MVMPDVQQSLKKIIFYNPIFDIDKMSFFDIVGSTVVIILLSPEGVLV